ncbi:PREDICTED: xyloglucan-specific galacturonosyltransferase 1-like [Nicotiana attenuata]|uniref:Xyloglucan-specific galacturonosyltransferase 1 n=1 Tax=Nicotiana attenuata TaxID=49451 RepID=A0A314L544_NICAT|nr:PREDICTED: xyloglucan-specific galacturonosyltransferase 1-like [Nicotiana attenuata]OIT36615.1 xyloglucan-specific galacturonosyltransferase 1 [Nicotiana attenuata]
MSSLEEIKSIVEEKGSRKSLLATKKMTTSISKKKARLSKKEANELGTFFYSILAKLLCLIPIAILFFLLIFFWSSSTTNIISGKIIHLCFQSRKLNDLYCISAGTQPNLETPISSFSNGSFPSVNGTATKLVNDLQQKSTRLGIPIPPGYHAFRNGMVKSDEELLVAYNDVEDQLMVHRSWTSSQNNAKCDGRGIYVYELPTKFNKDLVSQCADMVPWVDLCNFFSNDAMGEPVEKLGKGWYQTHQYSLELIFHSRILNHPCRVMNKSEAELFYVPFYAGLDVLRWHFKNVSNDVKDSLGLDLAKWLESQPTWFKRSGKDHVFVLGKISWDFRRYNNSDWGSRFLELDEMQNPVKLLIERQPWHLNDIGIPHPTYFHPQSDDDIITWQLKIIKANRKSLVSFAGAPRPDAPESIRSILINQCISIETGECRFLNCSSGACDQPESIIELFMESEFCLQPPGDSPTRKSVFDSLISGCIPVIFDPFTAYYQYPWHLPEDYKKYSVFIDQEDVRNMKVNVVEMLMKIPAGERENMRRYIIYELLPGLVYGDPKSKLEKFQDAFSITMNNLLQRLTRLE